MDAPSYFKPNRDNRTCTNNFCETQLNPCGDESTVCVTTNVSDELEPLFNCRCALALPPQASFNYVQYNICTVLYHLFVRCVLLFSGVKRRAQCTTRIRKRVCRRRRVRQTRRCARSRANAATTRLMVATYAAASTAMSTMRLRATANSSTTAASRT